MLRLYLTRHGETHWNTERRLQGWNDSPLTSTGIQYAKALGFKLKNVIFDYIYSSPSGRTLHTADLIKGNRKNEIIPADALKEINLGLWEGKLDSEVREHFPEEREIFWNKPQDFKIEGAETFYDVEKRAMEFVNCLIEEHKNKEQEINILLVTHTVTLKTIMMNFEQRNIEKLWDPPFIYPTSLSLVEITNKDSKILLHGDMSHIPENDE